MKPDNPALFLKDYLLAELAKRDAAVAPQNRWYVKSCLTTQALKLNGGTLVSANLVMVGALVQCLWLQLVHCNLRWAVHCMREHYFLR